MHEHCNCASHRADSCSRIFLVTCTEYVLSCFLSFGHLTSRAATKCLSDFYDSERDKLYKARNNSQFELLRLRFDLIKIDMLGCSKGSIPHSYHRLSSCHGCEVALGSNQADGSVNLPPHLAFPTPPCPQACIHPTQRLSQGLASHSH